MADNIHPVVELLAARMESHPEEFEPNGGGRWAEWLDQLIPHVTKEERVMLRGPIMQTIHEEVLDELLNGEERRAEERRQREEAEKRAAQKLQAQIQQMNAMQQVQQASQLYGQTQQYASHVAPANLRLGSETIDEGMVKQIKRKLGL